MRKLIGLFMFILTGSFLLVSSFNNSDNVSIQILVVIVGFFYSLGIIDHFKEIQGGKS